MTPAQVGQQLNAAYVLTGTLRRAGNRLRITTQLVDTRTDFPLWCERYDREMKDVFEVQDEIARKIAEALRVTLSPQELEALAIKPTENLQAYDLYLRGKRYARRQTRQDLEFALQMFENAVAMDPSFALAYAACANACAMFYCNYSRDVVVGGARAGGFGQSRGAALGPARSAGQPGLGAVRYRAARRSSAHGAERPSNERTIAKARTTFCAARYFQRDAIRKSST